MQSGQILRYVLSFHLPRLILMLFFCTINKGELFASYSHGTRLELLHISVISVCNKPATDDFPIIENQKTREKCNFNHCKMCSK